MMNKQTFLNQFLLHTSNHHYFEGQFTKNEHSKKAAVLIPLVERDNRLYLILTVRSTYLRHHPGQVSFPGGRFEEKDVSLMHTALRETQEEIGIASKDINVFANLPELVTNSNYIVSPYLAFIDKDHQIQIDKNEVQATFEIPLSFLLNQQNTHAVSFIRNEQPFTTYCTNYQGHLIWGVTAQIINTIKSFLPPI